MARFRMVLVALAVLAIDAGAAQGQRFGAQLDWGTDTDLGIGVRLEHDFGASLAAEGALSRAYLIGSFDYFPDCGRFDCTYFEFNGNLAVPVDATSNLNPYVGGGLNIGRISVDSEGESASDTRFGLNALGGIKFAIGYLASFAEARIELKEESQLVLTWGVMLGGHR